MNLTETVQETVKSPALMVTHVHVTYITDYMFDS